MVDARDGDSSGIIDGAMVEITTSDAPIGVDGRDLSIDCPYGVNALAD